MIVVEWMSNGDLTPQNDHSACFYSIVQYLLRSDEGLFKALTEVIAFRLFNTSSLRSDDFAYRLSFVSSPVEGPFGSDIVVSVVFYFYRYLRVGFFGQLSASAS